MNSQSHESEKIKTLDKVIDYDPITVTPELWARDAIKIMQGLVKNKASSQEKERSFCDNNNLKKSSYVLVVDSGKLVGIFTERDLVKSIADRVDLADKKVGEVMTSKLITLQKYQNEDLAIALTIMRENRIRHLPVVNDGGELIGIITQKNIRSAITPSSLLKMRRVSEVMSRSVVTSSGQVFAIEIARLMKQHQVSCIVIVKTKTASENITIPVGIITERDLVRYQIANLDFVTTKASAVMSQPLVPIDPEDSLWKTHQLMEAKDLRRMVVVEKSGELAGIVTQTSILRVFDPLEMSRTIDLLQSEVDKQTIELNRVQQQLENELQMTRSRLRNLLTFSPAIIYSRKITEDLLSIGFVSENVSSILGYRSSSFFADRFFWRDRIHPEDRDRVINELSKILENAEGATEYRFRHQKGHYLWLRDELKLVQDSEGRAIELVGYWIDITEKKQMENQLFHSQRLEILGTLASGIAHDFNNILTPIIGIAQLLPLKFPNSDSETQNLFSLLEYNSKRGVELVRQILSFARKSSGKLSNLKVSNLLLEIVATIRNTFPKSIEIYLKLDSDLHSWKVLGNKTRLYQVFMNLCINARDAMPDGGTLTISLENIYIDENYLQIHNSAPIGSYVVVTVTDTGIGIPDEIKKKIFEPFFTTKERLKGTGLGLSTVMTIIKNHNGFLNVYSELGKGSQFKVYLPAVEPKSNQAKTKLQLKSGNQELILIVDDEVTIQQITKAFLEKYNYRTLLARNGIEAIEIYKQHPRKIDAVLMDMMMPSMNGLKAIQSLQEIDSQVKIIATSGIFSPERIANLNAAGIEHILSKPYTLTKLLNTLDRAIASKKIDA